MKWKSQPFCLNIIFLCFLTTLLKNLTIVHLKKNVPTGSTKCAAAHVTQTQAVAGWTRRTPNPSLWDSLSWEFAVKTQEASWGYSTCQVTRLLAKTTNSRFCVLKNQPIEPTESCLWGRRRRWSRNTKQH